MSLHDTDSLIVEAATAAESLPDPTTVGQRTHILVNTGSAAAVWSSIGATPFTENAVNAVTITVAPGSAKMVQSNGTRWVVTTIGSSSVGNRIIQLHFSRGGDNNNKWMEVDDGLKESDVQPHVVAYAGTIKKVTWTAKNGGSDKIQIFKNAVMVHQCANTGLRGLENVNIPVAINDLISIFVVDAGPNYSYFHVILYIEV